MSKTYATFVQRGLDFRIDGTTRQPERHHVAGLARDDELHPMQAAFIRRDAFILVERR